MRLHPALWLLAAALPAAAQTAVPSRGELLYANHCGECHTQQMHWRANSVVGDWAALQAQVRHWQARSLLNWGDEDIVEVARHLNDTIYHLPTATTKIARATP
jgi:mono/diheme cytochrome c family protein